MHDANSTLRIATAGSVDDGKSTLIGRLLHDTKTVFEDQLVAVERASRRYGDGSVNLALLTDGLRAEREQGITIDVAHRYFATPKRSFIVADTPGHAQYTRNMVTGASTSDVAMILVDARSGVVEQTRRHARIAALLRMPAVVVVVNKMDLVDWDQGTFDRIVKELHGHLDDVDLPATAPQLFAVPVSALHGDNVVERSAQSPWYDGPTLLDLLESYTPPTRAAAGGRLHVQRVIRPQGGEHADFRGYAGVVTGGTFAVGDRVVVLPSGRAATVTGLHRVGAPVTQAASGAAVVIELDQPVDIARGDVIVTADAPLRPVVTEEIEVDLCWMIDSDLRAGTRVWFKHGARSARATVAQVVHRVDLAEMSATEADTLELNDIGRVRLLLGEPTVVDRFADDAMGGRLILVDEATNVTAAAAIVHATRWGD